MTRPTPEEFGLSLNWSSDDLNRVEMWEYIRRLEDEVEQLRSSTIFKTYLVNLEIRETLRKMQEADLEYKESVLAPQTNGGE